MIPAWVKLAAGFGALLAVAFGTWYFTAEYKDAVHTAAFDRYKRELAELHQQNLNEVLQKEREARERADEIGVKYHETTDTIDALRRSNSVLARELGGLRDPGKRPDTTSGMGSAQGTTPGNTPNQAADGQLSREATRFLLDFAADADRAAAYANACYEWVNRDKPPDEVRKTP